eukprot:scaffold1468_cov71-Cyclotella_meneghiniana.AAC.5
MANELQIDPPEFKTSEEDDEEDDDVVEYFSLDAPGNFDLSEVLDESTLHVAEMLMSSSNAQNGMIFKVETDDGQMYALTRSQTYANAEEGVRLLVPDDEDGEKLEPYLLKGQLNLIAGVSHNIVGDGVSNIQTDLLLAAPAADSAPEPALGESGNGAIDKMRLAYAPVPQRENLKRRWSMPGSGHAPQSTKSANEDDASKDATQKRSPRKKSRR